MASVSNIAPGDGKRKRTSSMEDNEASHPNTTLPLISRWYKHRCSGNCPSRWSEYPHVDGDYQALVERTINVPIIHRSSNRQGKWVTSSIKVQNASMQQVLKKALHGYQNIDLDLIDYTFTPPYVRRSVIIQHGSIELILTR
jgi:hypothetical protein